MPYEKIGKNEPVCIAEEIPFEIPDSWEWVRLGNVFQHNTGKALNSTNRTGHLLKYITTSNLYWNRFELDNLKSMYFTDSEIEKCTVQKGDLLVCEGGDFGRSAIWPYETKICIQNHIHKLRAYFPIQKKYYYFLFYLYKKTNRIGGKGIGIQGLSSNALHSLLFPLPPLAEQERIVNRIEEITPYTDNFFTLSERLNNLDALFPELLKKSVLQEAIKGALVPQNTTDEPASILIERIRNEKQKLIKKGELKKEKHESVIIRRDNSYYEMSNKIEHGIDEELPFEIPETWAWARLRDICFDLRYGTSNKSSLTGDIIVLRMGNIQNGEIDYSDLVFSSNQKDNEKYRLEPMDILFNRTNSREHVGKTGIYRGEYPAIFAGYLVQIKPIHINPEYLNIVMNSEYERNYCKDVKYDGINQSNVNATKIGHFLIPVPPINEQKRIVESINRILPVMAAFKEKM